MIIIVTDNILYPSPVTNVKSNEKNLYTLLKTKEIIAILDGDTKYQEYKFADGTTVPVSLPYLRGQDLCDVSTLFDLPMSYSWGKGAANLSRW